MLVLKIRNSGMQQATSVEGHSVHVDGMYVLNNDDDGKLILPTDTF